MRVALGWRGMGRDKRLGLEGVLCRYITLPINFTHEVKSFMAFSYTIVFIILLPQIFQDSGVWGAKLTFTNNCSQTIWPAILGQPRLPNSGFELSTGNSVAVQAPSANWTGRLWGRTGCTFNASGYGSCATGDCGSGQIECNTNATTTTRVELRLGGPSNLDFYDVSLVDGYNLPLLVEGGSGRCGSAGCTEDLNQVCPPELRTEGGGVCRGACEVFNTPEYCCTGNSKCGPTNYSRVFKEACPSAYSYPLDDANTTFTCTTGADYIITFCPRSSAQTGEEGKISTTVIIIVVVLSITGVITVCIILYCFLKRRHSTSDPNKESEQHIESFLLQHGSLAPKRYKYSEIEQITKSFSDKLGKGGYGSVYKGMLPDGCPVAVKVLIETDSNGEEFINEVASISRTSHVNIVSLLGFCYEGNKRALVYEYMPKKSLDKFLSKNGSADDTECLLDLEKLYKISVGIAKGLEYLHTGCSTRIVHFDIKPQNILLDEDFCPKISDFGLAKLCKKKQSVLSVFGTRGTIGYIAPEIIFRNLGGASHKSDVYSYGMMVLEMAGARKIVEAEVTQSSETNYFPDKIYEQVLIDVSKISDDFMIEEEETRRKMFLVGFWCIQTTPSERPSISKVVEMLEGSLQSIQIPPKPVLFTHNLSKQEISSSFSAHVDTENSADQDSISVSAVDTN